MGMFKNIIKEIRETEAPVRVDGKVVGWAKSRKEYLEIEAAHKKSKK